MATVMNLPTPRGVAWRTCTALFLGLVGLILGAVPGWSTCFAVWLVVAWLFLGAIAFATFGVTMAALSDTAWARARSEARQLLVVVLVALAMLPMGRVSTWIEFAKVRADLLAHSDESARAGGLRLAMSEDASREEGFVYDPGGVLAGPWPRRTDAWPTEPILARLSGECARFSPFWGAYWRWSDSCDGLF